MEYGIMNECQTMQHARRATIILFKYDGLIKRAYWDASIDILVMRIALICTRSWDNLNDMHVSIADDSRSDERQPRALCRASRPKFTVSFTDNSDVIYSWKTDTDAPGIGTKASRKTRKTAGERDSPREGRGNAVTTPIFARPINLFVRRCFIILSDSARDRPSWRFPRLWTGDWQFLQENNNGAGEIGSTETIARSRCASYLSLL